MIKDENDIKNIEKVITQHFELLKKCYVNIISRSLYPMITALDYSHFVQKAGMIDKNLILSGADRAFIATNVKRRDIGYNL